MSDLAALIDEMLEEEFELSPVTASALGLTEYDAGMDDVSAEGFAERDRDAADFLARFGTIGDGALGADERIDRDLAIATLRGRLVMAEWLGWRRDPLTYSGPAINGIFLLFLHRLRPDQDLVDAATSRLAQVPGVFDHGRANLDPALAHPVLIERGAGSARAAARYLREYLPDETRDAELSERLRSAGARAAEAFEDWARFLDGFRARARGSWVFGEERYSRILLEREALGMDARTLRERGQAEFDRLDAEMSALALRIGGTSDWHEVIEGSMADHPITEEAMRQAYEVWTARSRDFLAREGLVTLPDDEECLVEPSPLFQRPVLGVASYMAPPAFSDSLTGHFFVPFAPDGTSDEEIDKRLSSNSHPSIPAVSVHEAYPGHHWHLVMRRLHASRLRKVISTPYFNEGWALYAERMMRERGFFDEPMVQLNQLESSIFRALRIVVDTSLHMGEMTFDEAVERMHTGLAMSEPTARAEVGRYCAWPTQASSYLTGCLGILDIRSRWLAARGLGDVPIADLDPGVLREFHDGITASGSLPIGLAARVMLGE
ncbi:MAG: DUF885 domain-containing protein [Candidatus Limnocylindrales bacterium]